MNDEMWLLDRNLWYVLRYYRSGCRWMFFSFWWSGTLKTICWTPPVNIDGNITGVEKRKHFAGGVNKQTKNLYECLHFVNFYLFFFIVFFLLISNDHNFQWILQNIDLGLWINDIFERRVPFCGAYGSWWQIMAGQFCRQSTHRRLLKIQIQIQNKQRKIKSAKLWHGNFEGLEEYLVDQWTWTEICICNDIVALHSFFLYNCEGENY